MAKGDDHDGKPASGDEGGKHRRELAPTGTRATRRMFAFSIATVLMAALVAWWISSTRPEYRITSNKPEPNVGLTWYSDTDPTLSPGVAAPLYQFLVRTDVPSLYYKSGGANTAWTLIGAIPSPGTITGSGSAGDITAWTGTETIGNYAGSGSGCGSGSGVTLVSFNAKGSASVTCTALATGTVTTTGSPASPHLSKFSGTASITDFTGSNSNTCGAGSAVTSAAIDPSGNLSVTCATAGTGTVTSTGSAGYIAAFTTGTNIGNWSGSACGAGSAIGSIDGSGNITCIATGFSASTLNNPYAGQSTGTITFDGTATVCNVAPVANVYTLTEDCPSTTATINNGITVKTSGWHIFVAGTFTNNGIVSDNGADGSAAAPNDVNGTGGAARAAGFYIANAAGHVGGGGGQPGNLTNAPRCYAQTLSVASGGTAPGGTCGSTNGGDGGNGGLLQGGGAGGGQPGSSLAGATGDTSGSIALTTSATYGCADLYAFQRAIAIANVNQTLTLTGGGGGGGGTGGIGGGGNGGGGGGGGASGGIVYVAARVIAGNGSFSVHGGAGGAGGAGTPNSNGGGGGGGGGAGGYLILVYSHNAGTWTTNVSGGAGGAGGAGGNTCAASHGGAGGSGGSGLLLKWSGDGT